MAISITKGKNTLLLTIVKELDREDVYNLHSELGKWLEETTELPKFKGIDDEAVREAWEYSQRKLELEKQMQELAMKEYVARIKPTQHIEKELKTIELDPLNREIEITKTKLKENVKRK